MSKWIDLETDASTGKPYLWKCDECGEEVETRWNYCPECGDPKTGKAKSINTLVKALETEHRKLREMQSATDKNVGTTDTINRQQAIDAVTDELDTIDHVPQWVFDRLEKRLKQLPPAQTEQHHDEWCTDCKEYDKERHCCPRWNKVIRQALADAQPQRTGKWIPADSQCGIRCSVCGAPVDDFCHSIDYIDLDYEPNFCPNCGAKMEGGTE